MRLGNNLIKARKKSALSQEEVAEKLGVSRQTISKWELEETIPDIRQAKKLASIYHISLDELIDIDLDVQEIQKVITETNDKVTNKIDWNKAWSKKYPILSEYKQQVNSEYYAKQLKILLNDLKKQYNYSDLDALLVLKDILVTVWKTK
ncbi:helix-turn-helix transcriptional regulator [Mycoplasma sp. P36-A1]|uniref:helix-turn-helix transcriptional regulator n=1 Tax=Mycoplasma sp. P36-A1 TaxID=3252900 RepID=UPI003C2BB89C